MSDQSYEEKISDFEKRKFSGRDLLMIMEYTGLGVGATIFTVKELEIKINKDSGYRKFDYPIENA